MAKLSPEACWFRVGDGELWSVEEEGGGTKAQYVGLSPESRAL